MDLDQLTVRDNPERHRFEIDLGDGSFALDAARERGLKAIPICPFFAAYMQEHAEVQDLLDTAWRKRFGLD